MNGLPTHYYSDSLGREVDIPSLDRGQLIGALRKRENLLGGGQDTSGVVDALRAELAKRDRQPPHPETVTGTRALQRADKSLTTTKDNHPPDDPFTEQLAENYAQILSDIAEHELMASMLPDAAEIDCEEKVVEITAWVTKARELYRAAERARKEAKAPYLESGKKVDAFFESIQVGITATAKSVEQRPAAYMNAKRQRLEAEEKARAEAARREQERAAAEAKKAAAEALERQQAIEAEEKALREAKDAKARAAREEELRLATLEADKANRAAAKAAEEAQKLDRQATRLEAKADTDSSRKLERTVGGGGAMSLKTVTRYRIDDPKALQASLGPLGPWISSSALVEALDRLARDIPEPVIPGVAFWSESAITTHVTRNNS